MLILKVKEPIIELTPDKESSKPGATNSRVVGWRWHIYGDVKEIAYGTRLYDEEELFTKIPENEVMAQYVEPAGAYTVKTPNGFCRMPLDRLFDDPQADTRFIYVTMETSDGYKYIAFNTEAFLCNDRGDTVERLGI